MATFGMRHVVLWVDIPLDIPLGLDAGIARSGHDRLGRGLANPTPAATKSIDRP